MPDHYVRGRGRALRLRRCRVHSTRHRYWSISENGRRLDTALTLPAARRRAKAIIEGGATS